MLDFAWDFLGFFFLIVYRAMCVWASEGMHKKTVGQQDILLTLGTEDGLSYYYYFFFQLLALCCANRSEH